MTNTASAENDPRPAGDKLQIASEGSHPPDDAHALAAEEAAGPRPGAIYAYIYTYNTQCFCFVCVFVLFYI